MERKSMEAATAAEYRCDDGGSTLPFARGGPIYVAGLVGPLTSVPDFRSSVLPELHGLHAELHGSAGEFDIELSVDELRVFTEEELVEKALREEIQDAPGDGDLPERLEYTNEGTLDHSCVSGKENICTEASAVDSISLTSCISQNDSSIVTSNVDSSEKAIQQRKKKKRGRTFDRNNRAAELEGSYFAKVKQLAKIKEKQDEDKLAARLHSFSNHITWKAGHMAVTTSEKLLCLLDTNVASSVDSDLSSQLSSPIVRILLRRLNTQDQMLVTKDNKFCFHYYMNGSFKSLDGEISTSEKIERMKSLRFITSPIKVRTSNSQRHVPLSNQEVILCVEIYHKKNASKKIQEFLVLGSQTLTELRDNIYCLTDKLMQTAEQHDPSGYFLIEDTFYNDLRRPSATDYTKPIFEWLKKCKDEALEKWEHIISGELKKKQKELLGDVEIPNLPSFRAMDMHKTRFSDLRFRLGAGYLYCHQGNCKHIIVIRDMRLIHPEDAQNQADYPLLTFQLRPRHRKCSVCKIYHATKMTVDDKWAPKNPCYFCIKCYFLLHYKEDNSLLYPHLVFDYYHE